MTIYLIIGGIIVLLSALVFVLVVVIKDNIKQINALKKDNKTLTDNVFSLVKYSELITKMRKEKEALNEELLQAETPEEIMCIIDRIISSNNERVRK